MGGRGSSSVSSKVQRFGDSGYGISSSDGSLKKAIAYHGTSSDFDNFDSSFSNSRHQVWGEGFYLASDPGTAALFGNSVYEVEITYSTDLRTSKKTGREWDFQYNKDNGYWVVPHSKASNLKILNKNVVR